MSEQIALLHTQVRNCSYKNIYPFYNEREGKPCSICRILRILEKEYLGRFSNRQLSLGKTMTMVAWNYMIFYRYLQVFNKPVFVSVLKPCFWMNGLRSSFLFNEGETQKRSELFSFKCASNILISTCSLLEKAFSSTFLGIMTAATIINFFSEVLSNLRCLRLSIILPTSTFLSTSFISLIRLVKSYWEYLRAGA